jgi:hypothetical protein
MHLSLSCWSIAISVTTRKRVRANDNRHAATIALAGLRAIRAIAQIEIGNYASSGSARCAAISEVAPLVGRQRVGASYARSARPARPRLRAVVLGLRVADNCMRATG